MEILINFIMWKTLFNYEELLWHKQTWYGYINMQLYKLPGKVN